MLGFLVAMLMSGSFDGENQQAVGFYSNGSQINANVLPNEGEGFVKIFQPRERGYASYDLISILQAVAAEMKSARPEIERIQIGDMSTKNGGFASGHGSHQNGLDVDVVFLRNDRREMPTHTTNGFDEQFVDSKGVVSKNFDIASNFALASAWIATGRVNRIFMDPAIKKVFCKYAPEQTEVLRRMRPLAHHKDHFHLRITCPINSPKCIKQDEPPAGDGCDDLRFDLDIDSGTHSNDEAC